MSQEQTVETPAPYVSLSKQGSAELTKALEAAGVPMETAPTEAPKTDAPPQAPVKKEGDGSPTDDGGAKKEDSLPTLLRLAKERDTQRKLLEQKEIEAAKPYLDALKGIPPHTAQALAKAIQAGDPAGLLAAAGMTHAAPSVLAKLQEKGTEPSAQPQVDPAQLKAELDALRREREQERVQTSRQQMLGQMQSILKDDPKYKTINGLGDYEGVEGVLIRYHTQYGQLPGQTLEESVQLAAELYEYELRNQAERFRPYLTGEAQAAVVTKQAAPENKPTTGVATVRTLTNANSSAPAAPKTFPKTRQEIIQALKEGRDIDLE